MKSVFFEEGSSESLNLFENKLHVTAVAVDPRYKVSVFPDDVKCLAKRWILSGIKQELKFRKKDDYIEMIASDQPTKASSSTCSSSPTMAYSSRSHSHFQSDIAKTFLSFCACEQNEEASPSKRKKTNNRPTDDQLNTEIDMLIAEKNLKKLAKEEEELL